MAFNPSSPVTGAAITGLTSPTYTIVSDTPPSINAKTYAVTALGGTQTGVLTHSPDTPFNVTFKRPALLKTLGSKNPITGQYTQVPKNEYGMFFRKGVAIQTGQYDVLAVDIRFRVPAGAATYDSVQMKALASFLGGMITAQIQGVLDTELTGVM